MHHVQLRNGSVEANLDDPKLWRTQCFVRDPGMHEAGDANVAVAQSRHHTKADVTGFSSRLLSNLSIARTNR